MSRSLHRIVGLGIVCMGLAACGVHAEPDQPVTATITAPVAPTMADQETVRPPETPAPKAEPAFAVFNMADIEKADEAGLVALLGQPAFERKDRDARLLRFEGETCQISAFLYTGQAAGSWKIDHVEARDLTGKSMQTAQCLKAFKRLPA